MSEPDETAVFVSSLQKEYRIGDVTIEALKGLNLKVAEGEFVAIHGPSGAGKTTLLNIIGGLDKPTAGEVVVFGHSLNAYEEDFLATFRCVYIGFVFQSYNLISTLTAQENVAFPIEIAGWESKRASERANKLLDIVGLSHRANHFPFQLSGGEQQRVAFARALANDPPLLLVDEPTGNLDLETSLEIVHMLERLKAEKKTIIVVTHDERIMQLAKRTLELRNGKIVGVNE
ncbi:MAG: ABC transporter ATP-binding protein [Candidatus Bathyarchaeia archaeon]